MICWTLRTIKSKVNFKRNIENPGPLHRILGARKVLAPPRTGADAWTTNYNWTNTLMFFLKKRRAEEEEVWLKDRERSEVRGLN